MLTSNSKFSETTQIPFFFFKKKEEVDELQHIQLQHKARYQPVINQLINNYKLLTNHLNSNVVA